MHRLLLLSALGCGFSLTVWMTLASTGRAEPEIPRIAPASNEGQRETKRIQAPSGMRADLWAAEPLLANPVCFAIDEHNRIYVAETFRLHRGVTDIRGHMNWLIEDLACRTVGDREAIHRRHESRAQLRALQQASERVTLLED